ncbi:receptor expression-enhancing protein 2-like isoform X3 [Bolinopsis microptera]|uniref:receptor expression-enhancing protein 2-like isoform X3 n=1 Tax=Bolinopsis microptera TaxID=2820187 RepID=UPI00307ADB12
MSDLFGGLVLISAGTLYPAYSSYKAVKTKNTREYVKWMMYWIVFAFFNALTLFTDIFISWFPGYYLFKTLFIIWLVSPATRGSTYLYKKVLHPTLRRNEEKIDKTIANIKERGYDYTSQYARLAMQNFSRTLMEAVFRGQVMIADQMQRQYMQNNIVLEDENGNPVHVLSSNVVYSGDHMTGAPQHVITSPQQHITHTTTNSAEPYSQYTDENVFELQEYEEFEPPPQSAARQRRRAHKSRGNRPKSMPPPTIDEIQHPLGDPLDDQYLEGVQSDPDYAPDDELENSSKSSKRQAAEQRRVTRSSARKDDAVVSPPVEDEDDFFD